MKTQKDIDREISDITSLKDLADVYGEIASIRMIKIRDYVLSNREFISSITDIFSDTLAAYQKKAESKAMASRNNRGDFPEQKAGQPARSGKITFLSHNGKTVSVLISANTGFYGSVVQSTFRKFISDLEKTNFEVTVIGRVGRQYFLSAMPNKPYTYFDLPDYGIDRAKLSDVIRHLVQYEEIRIYYGKYLTVLKQEPAISKITAGTQIEGARKKETIDYIFEPTIEKILMFFEKEIFASFFDQALRESQLAKFASRIFAMDRASQNISKRLGSLKFENLRLSHARKNKKQLNSLGSILYTMR